MKASVSFLLIVFFIPLLFIVSCNSEKKCEKKLNKKIQFASFSDKKIDEVDYNNIKSYLIQYKEKCGMYQELLKSDSALCGYIKKRVKNVEVEACEIIPSLNRIRFYVETSLSMAGYMKGGKEFQETVNNLIGVLGGNYNFNRFIPNTIVDSTVPYGVDDFRYRLTNGRFPFSGHSPLDNIFRIILENTGANDINFLITDGIMSGSNADIAQNPQFNIQQQALMRNLIRSRFDGVRDAYGISVYGFKSRFNSNPTDHICYYTYNNGPIYQNFTRRPFYIFVFGNRKLLSEINKVLKSNDRLFLPEKELHFGVQNKPIRFYTAFHSHLPIYELRSCYPRDDGSIKINRGYPSAVKPVKFAIGLNLSSLHDYAKTDNYLHKGHLIIEPTNNLKMKNSDSQILPVDPIKSKIQSNVEIRKINSLGITHYLNLVVTDLYTPKENITVKLLKEEDRWYESWSCDNDMDIGFDQDIQEKTFNFKWLVYGIRDAYNQPGESFVEISIPVNK
jgi:hypothetical protein